MQIEGVISGIVVMITSPAGSVIPEPFQFLHGVGTLPVHIVEETGIRFFAVPLPGHIHLERLVEKILLCGHNVDDVAQGRRSVGRGIHMDMDTAGVVDLCARFPQLADELLNGFDVLIDADGRYHFYRIDFAGRTAAAVFTVDRGIADQLPLRFCSSLTT